ncbi:4-(cytidine 5'-diphospho)-2-C-methyl-D-erythritol kinase [Akkermansiaceae bacterium]|nr:4-(cytidine 5'-diphospho)-2-C-methyl-D-erythritol kinase [Akkermansiaceae bacterium]
MQKTWKAPAKTNLTLKVLGKRDDGFHELEMFMVPLSLHDVLHFEKSDHYSLHCDLEGVPTDERNLVTMAVRSFEKRTGRPCLWKITLEKNVPHGAGMGGGSSDAATTLLALNTLEETNIPLDDLAAMSAEFGSDVPFFIYQNYCMVRGRGEIVEPVNPRETEGVSNLSGTPILLLKPSFGVSTPDAFKQCLNAEAVHGVDYSAQKMPWGEIFNDLEKPVFYKYRFLAEMKVWLLAQPEVKAAMMSGSGSTMLAFLRDGADTDIEADSEALKTRALAELDPTLWAELTHIL